MKKLRMAAEVAGIFGALVAEFTLLALLGWTRAVRSKYDDERIN